MVSNRRAWLFSGRALGLVAIAAGMLITAPMASALPSCAEGPELRAAAGEIQGTECSDVIVVSAPNIEEVAGGGGDDLIVVNGDVLKVVGGSGDDEIYGEQLPAHVMEDTISKHLAETDPSTTVYDIETSSLSRVERRLLRQNLVRSVRGGGASASVLIYGGMNTQNLYGGPGDDYIFGQRGNDNIFGDNGNDVVYGGPGDDVIYGQEGADIVGGGFGTDTMDGNNGNDLLRGDGTTDNISDTGGSGTDTLSFATATAPGFQASMAPWANFPPEGGERGVYVRLDGIPCGGADYEACNGDAATGGGFDQIVGWQFENVIGSPFSDLIVGNAWNNRIDGGGGADVIYGSAGNDMLIGGADGDYLNGEEGVDFANGLGGIDNCIAAETKEWCNGEAQAVNTRDKSKVSAGFMQNTLDPSLRSTSLYLVGSNTHDSVQGLTWSDPVTLNQYVIFKMLPDSWSTFDTSADAATPGCSYAPSEVSCHLPALADAVLMAGMDHHDQINIHEGTIGAHTATVLTGGTGSDSIWGSATSEDVLIDGEDAGNDYLVSFGFDDVLLNGGGRDELQGGLGNDLIISTQICGDDYLHGAGTTYGDGAALNNASWAKLPAPWGVVASLESGLAGNEYNGGPYCANGGNADLVAIDDLEGSSQVDHLVGDGNPNSIMGRDGNDSLYGRGGADRMLAGENNKREGVDFVAGEGGVDPVCQVDTLDTLKTCP